MSAPPHAEFLEHALGRVQDRVAERRDRVRERAGTSYLDMAWEPMQVFGALAAAYARARP